MSDSPMHTGGQDRARINVHQAHELRDWSKHFGVSHDALKEAVRAVGDRAAEVQRYFATQDSAARGTGQAADPRTSHVEPSTHSTREVDEKLRGVERRVGEQPGAGSPATKPNRELDAHGKPAPDVLDLRGG